MMDNKRRMNKRQRIQKLYRAGRALRTTLIVSEGVGGKVDGIWKFLPPALGTLTSKKRCRGGML